MPPEDNARDADIAILAPILCWKHNLVLLPMHKMFLVELWRNITHTLSESANHNNFFGDFCGDSFKTWKSQPNLSSVNHVLPCHLLQQTVTGNSLLNTVANNSLWKHPFHLALRRWDVISVEFLQLSRRRSSSRNVPGGEERGETDVFAGYRK